MSTIRMKDGTEIYYKDWGSGPPVVLSHGWPLNSDSWELQMLFLASNGYRVIAHDRRGHGRSSQSWNGNEMDTYADDLAQVLDELDVRDGVIIGFSTGGGEVTRYLGRHGTKRFRKAVLVSAVPPLMLKTPDNPAGTPKEAFDGLRSASIKDRSSLYYELARGPFFGYNRAGTTPSEGYIQSFWMQGMMAGHKNAYDCIKAFSETDFRDDLRKIDIPVLSIHGDDDQIVPIKASADARGTLLKRGTLKIYPGAPHGLTHTHQEALNRDLLDFIRS